MFAINHVDRHYHPKEWVLGVEVRGIAKAYPFSELKKLKTVLDDEVNGQKVRIHFSQRARTASATDVDGKPLPSMMAFWFAWYAFHPDTQVFTTGE